MEEDLIVQNAEDVTETFLTTGCAKLDALLKGGIPCRGITQIYGAAGTGKTQLALQLCLTVQLPIAAGGFEAGAIYICTDASFPSTRLQQLLRNSEMGKNNSVNGDVIFVDHIATSDELELCLCRKIPLLLNIHKIRLLVIDSIAAPYRVEDWRDLVQSRAKSLRNVGRQLHELSKNNNLCVICINQVSAIINNPRVDFQDENEQPALGFTWASMVTFSIYFFRTDIKRYSRIVLASYLPRITFKFEVHAAGVRAIE